MRKLNLKFIILFITVFHELPAIAQTPAYPAPMLNQSIVSPAPDAQSMESYGSTPVALYEGLPGISIPIYQIRCGSLSLPISISYNYNGLSPIQDAGIIGLGWSLNAGGEITRMVEGLADGSQATGYNYGQYNLYDSLLGGGNPQHMLQQAYDNGMSYWHYSYDLQPDIYDCEFNAGSGRFIWCGGKAYQFSYDKQLGISWPSSTGPIIVTTQDGVAYTFGAIDVTTANLYGGATRSSYNYNSAWHLTMIVSADQKDTINLNYGSYEWQQYSTNNQTSYGASTGSQSSLGTDTTIFNVNPQVATEVLLSITCRNTRVSFVQNTTARTDVSTNYPSLAEIDIIDSLSSGIVKKNAFSYEYLGQTSTNPTTYERLKLKRFKSVNMLVSSDTLSYTFKYANEYGSFPSKGTLGIDFWGYYNGQDTATSLLPGSSSGYYSPSPSTTFGDGNARTPNPSYAVYGVLDTIVYPSGGYTTFQYGATYTGGPGLCVQSQQNFDGINPSPVFQKNYTYLGDNGLNSGDLLNPPLIVGDPFTYDSGTFNYTYYIYTAPLNIPGLGGASPLFFFQKVTESVTANNETHKTDHYFSSFSNILLDVRETERIDYINLPNTNDYTPVTKTITSFTSISDTSVTAAVPFIQQETYAAGLKPPYSYTYSYFYNTWNLYWAFPTQQQSTQYDKNGDSIVTTTYLNYNTSTQNLASTQQTGSDGQTVTQKFKYPEDYTTALTGNMVTSRVLSPIIEKETWIKQNSSDSALISGGITVFNQTTFKPITTYAIETTSPIASLNNQTMSGNQFSSILSDSRYIMKEQFQFDANDNPSTINRSADINISYLWDYRHNQPIAEVKNAAQADIAYTSFEADGTGNWTFTGSVTIDTTSPTGNNCYNVGQTSGSITKSSLTSSAAYTVSYWIKGTSALSITGTIAGYPVQGKTINGWTYFEHKITGQTSVTVSGSGTQYIDELRLYPYSAQMTTYTYSPLIGKTTQCDADNRITYFIYDGFGRLKVVKDQDHNIVKTVQYHYNGETAE